MAFSDRIYWLCPIFILIANGLIAGCSNSPYKAPIEDATSIPSFRMQTHTVAPGETLYSIAWRYDLDYKNLAKINGLSGGLKIVPGQVLALYGPVKASVNSAQKLPKKVSTPRGKAPVESAKVAGNDKKFQSKKTIGAPSSERPSSTLAWQWPVKGTLVARFHENGGLNRGIDIRGKLGEPIVAAASGEVVYSGSGLRGYGKLLIVKHDEKYLSAYAHNRVLHVAEGDRVKAGQKIAELGDTGSTTPKLHFEIRYDGQPVDPLAYLPKL